MHELKIKLLENGDAAAVGDFLRGNAQSTVFHTLDWNRVIHTTYGHDSNYWIALLNRQVVGVHPVVVVRHRLLGTKMIAMPYQFHCGVPLATGEDIQVELVKRAIAQARKVGAKYLEIRHHKSAPFLERLGFFPLESQLVTTYVPLAELELKRLRNGHRRNIRYAMEHGVTITEADTLAELKMFRHMYLVEGRRLGNPQAGWNFFENLHRFARGRYRLLLAWVSNRCLGGLLTLEDGRTSFGRCGAYNSPEAQSLYIGKALLWRCMSDAALRGCLHFDFGISSNRDKGLISFKEGWNGKTRPVYLYVYPIRSNPPVPGNYLDGFSAAKAVWRRLPLPLVDWAGRQVTQWVN